MSASSMGKKTRRERNRGVKERDYLPEERTTIVSDLLQSLADNQITVSNEPGLGELLKIASRYKEEGTRLDFAIPVNHGNHQLVGTFPNRPSCPSEVRLKKV